MVRLVFEFLIFIASITLIVFARSNEFFLGIGFLLLSTVLALFVIELFLAGRKSKVFGEEGLELFMQTRLGFDYHQESLLEEHDIDKDDLDNLENWFYVHAKEHKEKTRFWTKEFLDRVPPIGMDWASGYTLFLDKFAQEVKAESIPFDEHFFFTGYKRYIEEVERILAQAGEHNVLLLGEEGVGERFVLMGLERLVETGRALPALAYKRFIWLSNEALLSGITHPGVLRERVAGIFSEARDAGNIILGVEHFHSLLDPAFPEIADILIPFLESEDLQLVGTTTPRFLSTTFASRSDLLSLFHQVEVKEPSINDTLAILQEVSLQLEKRFGVFVLYPSLKKLAQLAQSLLPGARPQKDITLLNEAVSLIVSKGKKVLELSDVLELLSQRTGIPLGDIALGEREKLLSLEEVLHRNVIDQEEAVSVVAKALRRSRTQVRSQERPIGSFLFLGPTGVGKTTVAKVLAQTYFGSGDLMLRFDMSEFQQIEDIKRLIGYEEHREFQGGMLTEAIKSRPFSLILLDEVEKAHPNILNLFLQVLDEGMMTDGGGYKVNFRNTIIIATSNAGSEFIRSSIERVNLPTFPQELLDVIQKTGIFRPEFLNRFDAAVAFKPLGKKELLLIAQLLLEDLASRLKKDHNITFISSDELKELLATKGFNQEYGARPMRRVLQDTIESYIADRLLKGEIKRGEKVQIKASDLGLTEW